MAKKYIPSSLNQHAQRRRIGRYCFFSSRVFFLYIFCPPPMMLRCLICAKSLTLVGLQSRFGDNWGQITWNLSALPPKRDWSSKGVEPCFCLHGGKLSTGCTKMFRYTSLGARIPRHEHDHHSTTTARVPHTLQTLTHDKLEKGSSFLSDDAQQQLLDRTYTPWCRDEAS